MLDHHRPRQGAGLLAFLLIAKSLSRESRASGHALALSHFGTSFMAARCHAEPATRGSRAKRFAARFALTEETAMKTIVKTAAIASLAGVLAMGAMTPSQARGRWVGPAVGFAAGALVGAAAANASSNYYGYGYGYGDPYDAYDYAPGYVAPAPAYSEPAYYDYNRYNHGYDTNYQGPWNERRLEGRD
jgi:hypothetical protein